MHFCIEANGYVALQNKAGLCAGNFLVLLVFYFDTTVVSFELAVFTEARYLHQIMCGASFK